MHESLSRLQPLLCSMCSPCRGEQLLTAPLLSFLRHHSSSLCLRAPRGLAQAAPRGSHAFFLLQLPSGRILVAPVVPPVQQCWLEARARQMWYRVISASCFFCGWEPRLCTVREKIWWQSQSLIHILHSTLIFPCSSQVAEGWLHTRLGYGSRQHRQHP